MGGFTTGASQEFINVSRCKAANSEFYLTIARTVRNVYLLATIEEARAAMPRSFDAVFRQMEENANAYHEVAFATIKAYTANEAQTDMVKNLRANSSDFERLLKR